MIQILLHPYYRIEPNEAAIIWSIIGHYGREKKIAPNGFIPATECFSMEVTLITYHNSLAHISDEVIPQMIRAARSIISPCTQKARNTWSIA
jgi:hypothetical protein